MDLVNQVPIWASPSPGDFVPYRDQIAVDSFLASPGTGDSNPICASRRSGESGPYLVLSQPGDSGHHLDLTWTR